MSRFGVGSNLGAFIILTALVSTACGSGTGTSTQAAEAPAPPVAVSPVAAVEVPLARFIRVTGSLMADEQADVAAELAGRVVSAPFERGTRVAVGQELVRVSPVEAEAQVQEAEANAAQIEARLGMKRDDAFEADRVPEVQNAAATLALAESEFARVQSLLDQRVVSQSEFDSRRTQLEVAKRQVDVAKNAAAQQFQMLQAARARIVLARKALADTVVRAPFAGVVAERAISVGDYVTKGAKVAVVVRVDPLRVELTVPTQFIAAVSVGQSVDFEVDAYQGRTFRGQVRYVSPALEASQRALTVEAIVANPRAELKPGLFATARIEQTAKTPGVVVPAAAVQTSAGTSRVFVVAGDHVEERLVTIGQTLDERVEVTKGLKGGEQVATANIGQLVDGRKVKGN